MSYKGVCVFSSYRILDLGEDTTQDSATGSQSSNTISNIKRQPSVTSATVASSNQTATVKKQPSVTTSTVAASNQPTSGHRKQPSISSSSNNQAAATAAAPAPAAVPAAEAKKNQGTAANIMAAIKGRSNSILPIKGANPANIMWPANPTTIYKIPLEVVVQHGGCIVPPLVVQCVDQIRATGMLFMYSVLLHSLCF